MRAPARKLTDMVEGKARIVLATQSDVLSSEIRTGVENVEAMRATGLDGRHPTCLAADPLTPGRVWCGTARDGVFRSDDGGRSWVPSGLGGEEITSVSTDPVKEDVVRVGTEPSALWSSFDAGETWESARGLDALPSSSEWAFPPKPHTHHVRWIACHPRKHGHLWVAIEAGALVTTPDGGKRWLDRTPGGPFDTHEIAVHPARPESLRVAAGDGYHESDDGGASWSTPREGLGVRYLRSVAIDPVDPDVIVVSGASKARSTYVAGRSDGRVYRREARGRWERVLSGWPDPPETIAPLLIGGLERGELWAADERGIHRSEDGGRGWSLVIRLPHRPSHLRGLALIRASG